MTTVELQNLRLSDPEADPAELEGKEPDIPLMTGQNSAQDMAGDSNQPPIGRPRYLSKGVLYYLLGVMCNSLHHTLTKLVLQNVGTFETVQLRMLITAVIAVSLMAWQRVPYNFIGAPQHRKLLLVRGLLGFLVISFTYYSLKYLALPDVASLAFLTPMTTMLASAIFLGERVVWQQVCCSFVSLGGVVVIARPPALFGPEKGTEHESSPHRAIAVCACVVAVSSMGIVTTVLRKLKNANSTQSVGYYAICSAVGASLVVAAQVSHHAPKYPKDAWSWLLLLGMGSIGFTLQWLQSRALQLEEASYLVNFRYTNLCWATLWEVLIWGDWPDVWTLVGSAIVLSSVLYSASFKKN